MPSDLSVVSVCYNSSKLFLDISWRAFLDTTDLDIFLIDNGSPDNSGKILAAQYPQHHILQLGRNIGYGRAANAGIQECRTRYVLLLNPDIIIADESIEHLLRLAGSDLEKTAVWGPALKRADHRNEDPRCVEGVSGAAMLFDLGKIQKGQFFDSNIFLYSEETDLCYRIRQQGMLIKFCPAVFMDHTVDGSSGHNSSLVYMKAWHFAWSRCYFLDKHHLCTSKRNPQRMFRYYRIKSFISLDRLQRLRYRAQAAGVKAFLRGEKAFTGNDEPQMISSPTL